MHPQAAVDDSRVDSRVRDRVTSRVAGNTRPRVSASRHGIGRRSRPGRMARRCRSRAAATTTWVPTRVGCSVFLNNRYHDPTTGIFLSVDPLVSKTSQPYLYAGGNPTTLSDPSGLEPGCGATARAGTCGVAHRDVENTLDGCIVRASCDGARLVNSIHVQRKERLGGFVLAAIDVANQGNWDDADGNWSPKDVQAAADGTHLQSLISSKMAESGKSDTSSVATLVGVLQSVGSRLLDDNKLYERIDNEQSWWEQHGSDMLHIAVAVLSVTALFTAGSTGLIAGALAAAGSFSAAATDSAYGRCDSIVAGGCGLDSLGFALGVLPGTHLGDAAMLGISGIAASDNSAYLNPYLWRGQLPTLSGRVG